VCVCVRVENQTTETKITKLGTDIVHCPSRARELRTTVYRVPNIYDICMPRPIGQQNLKLQILMLWGYKVLTVGLDISHNRSTEKTPHGLQLRDD